MELVRTKTLVKNCIVQIDATPFRQYYLTEYNVVLGKHLEDETSVSTKVKKKREKRAKNASIDDSLKIQFRSGRLFACISSRPGQCGRADGLLSYILEGPELAFYIRRMQKKKK